MATASVNPPVTITLPIAGEADPGLICTCLQSVHAQTYSNIEVVVLVSSRPPRCQIEILDSFSSGRVLRAELTKSAARNLLATNARGEFLVFLDVDMELPATWVADCVGLASTEDLDAIIAPVISGQSMSFWDRCRALEKELLIGDPGAESPLFVRAQTFFDCGGFDESLDPLDDWALTLALKGSGASFGRVETTVVVRESASLRETFSRKYRRGQLLGALKAKYPGARQSNFTERFKTVYLQKWKVLIHDPLTSGGLALLKTVDMIGLWLGNANAPAPTPDDGSRVYFDPRIAQQYEQIRLGNAYNRYKHYSEVRSLATALPEGCSHVLELGSGTGRITRVLAGHGLNVIPVEPSAAMVRNYWADSGPRAPVIADGKAIPFNRDSFDASISLRVIWHFPTTAEVETMLSEMCRVASSFVIVDIANKARWRHPFIRLVAKMYFGRREADFIAHSSTHLLTLGEFAKMAQRIGLQCERAFPMDVLSPLWLNFLPRRVGNGLFPAVYALERALQGVIPPGRYMVVLSKSALHLSSPQAG